LPESLATSRRKIYSSGNQAGAVVTTTKDAKTSSEAIASEDVT
jgi:hypothetical protein